MSSASSSTVTAYNVNAHRDGRRHTSTTPTQSSSQAARQSRRPHTPSVVSSDARSSYTRAGSITPRGNGAVSIDGAARGGSASGAGNEGKGRIPITPAVLRDIFASSRTLIEERTISRVAFFRFAGFLLSCIGISLAAARSRPIHALGLGRS